MNTTSSFAVRWVAITLATISLGVHAATYYVTPGESIQAAVNGASSGDTIIIFGGTYSEDVTITGKRLSLQRL